MLDTIVFNCRKETQFHLFLDAALKTVAYLRVSTRSQDLANQKLAILEFSQKRRFPIDQFIESRISSRKSPIERRIEEMLGTLQSGDRLLVSELSRLGRSLGQVLQIVATLIERKIRFIAIKEAIEVEGKQDLRTKVMIAMFGLFAEVERDLISERTKEGLNCQDPGRLPFRPLPLHRDAQDRARLTRKPAWDSPGLMLYFNTNLVATPFWTVPVQRFSVRNAPTSHR